MLFSPDGNVFVESSDGVTIRKVESPASGVRLDVVGFNRKMAFTPDSRVLVCGNVCPEDPPRLCGTTTVWDVEKGESLFRIESPDEDDWICGVTTWPDSERLLIAYQRSGLYEYTLATNEMVRKLPPRKEECTAAGFCRATGQVFLGYHATDSETLAETEVWDFSGTEPEKKFTHATDPLRVYSVAASSGGAFYATGGVDPMAAAQDWFAIEQDRLAEEDEDYEEEFDERDYGPMDSAVARLWDGQSHQLLAEFGNHKEAIIALGFGADDKTLMTADTNSVSIWSIPEAELLERHEFKMIAGASLSSDGSRFGVNTFDWIELRTLPGGKREKRFRIPD